MLTLYDKLEDDTTAMSALERSLNCYVVTDKVLSYLNLADMKALSETSRTVNTAVRNNSQFLETALLPIVRETVSLGNMLVDSTLRWKVVRVDVSLPIDIIDIIDGILESVHTLQLKLILNLKVENKDLTKFLVFLLTKTPNLVHLDIDSLIMEEVLHDVFSDIQVQAQLSKLESLEISTGAMKRDMTHYINEAEDEEEEGPFQRNFLQISLIPMKLLSFKMAKINTMSNSESEHVKFIPNIVSANQDTLQELSLHLKVWRQEDMKMIRCQNLKRLTVTASREDCSVVVAFLRNQPFLEELSITVKEGCPVYLLNALRGKATKLKRLKFNAKCFPDISEPVDWSFLIDLHNLQDITIFKPYSINRDVLDFGTGITFLYMLPPSVKKITLRGIEDFWKDRKTGMKILDVEQIEMLDRFDHITQLSLIRCGDAVDDEVMQHIIRKFTNLRVLEVSHCSELTTYGLTGVHPAPLEAPEGWEPAEELEASEGLSLQQLTGLHYGYFNLLINIHGELGGFCTFVRVFRLLTNESIGCESGLRKLSIKACSSISFESLPKLVVFPYLEEFVYLSTVSVPISVLETIANQNRCLQSLSAFVSETESDIDIKRRLKAANNRICHFMNLNDDSWVENDSDSEADSADSWGDGDSDISGCDNKLHRLQEAYDDNVDESCSDGNDFEDDDDFYD